MLLSHSLICLPFTPVVATRTNKGACHFDVVCGPFKWPSGAWMWLHGTWQKSFQHLKKTKELGSLLNVVVVYLSVNS